jgi:hypothetical protein
MDQSSPRLSSGFGCLGTGLFLLIFCKRPLAGRIILG